MPFRFASFTPAGTTCRVSGQFTAPNSSRDSCACSIKADPVSGLNAASQSAPSSVGAVGLAETRAWRTRPSVYEHDVFRDQPQDLRPIRAAEQPKKMALAREPPNVPHLEHDAF
jgi:hypothetical protein